MLNPNNNQLPTEMSPIFLRLAPQDIVYLKAILESYDELGVLRTLDQKTGDVVILSLPDLKPALEGLLSSLVNEINFTILEAAPSNQASSNQASSNQDSGDWLVDEN